MSIKKIFTLKEANDLIPKLLQDIPRIQQFSKTLKQDFPDVKKAWKKVNFNGGSVQGTDYLRVALQLNRLLKALETKGCVLKGIENGLVDFPAILDGREVYLCWKLPEKEIRYWHDLDAGFAGRQLL